MKKWPEKARFYIQTFIHTTNEDKALKNSIGREKKLYSDFGEKKKLIFLELK